MASLRFIAVESTSARRFLLILPVCGQKVKGIGPSALEVLIGSRKEESAGSTNRALIAYCLGHDLDTGL